MDNDGPLTDHGSLDERDKLVAMFSSRGPNASEEEASAPIARDKVALRVEKYIMAVGLGEECKRRKIVVPRTFAEAPQDLRPCIVSWVSDLINILVTSHQRDHTVTRRAVEEAVGQVSMRLRDSSMGRVAGPVRELKNKVLEDAHVGSRERSRSAARVAAISGGWAPAPETAAPAVDDDLLPISYQDAIAGVKMPSWIDERPVLVPGMDMPEPWSNGDELNKMDDEQIRSYVRHVMKYRARREITEVMSDWGIHDSKHVRDLWSSFEQVVCWISPQDWKPILGSH